MPPGFEGAGGVVLSRFKKQPAHDVHDISITASGQTLYHSIQFLSRLFQFFPDIIPLQFLSRFLIALQGQREDEGKGVREAAAHAPRTNLAA